MPKKIDKEQEMKFVEYYVEGSTACNASQSAKKAGWVKNHKQMGAYLKKKYIQEIREKNEERISSTSGKAITVLQELLHSDQDAVRLNNWMSNSTLFEVEGADHVFNVKHPFKLEDKYSSQLQMVLHETISFFKD